MLTVDATLFTHNCHVCKKKYPERRFVHVNATCGPKTTILNATCGPKTTAHMWRSREQNDVPGIFFFSALNFSEISLEYFKNLGKRTNNA